MKKKVLFFLCFIIFVSIISFKKGYKVTSSDNDSVVHIPEEDAEMNEIIKNSRRTVNEFIVELKKPEGDKKSFKVKYPFATDPRSRVTQEHIWLTNLVEKNGKYKGEISNEVFWIKRLKKGDIVDFDINNVSDWMYIKNNKIYGGKSIKFLLDNISGSQMTQEEKDMLKMFK